MALQVNIEVPNLPNVVCAFTGASTIIRSHITSAIRQSITAIEVVAKSVTPVMTGKLRSSWTREISSLSGSLYNTMPYAVYVHEGTKPHMISAKNRQILADKKKQIFFGKQVMHPGSRKQPFLQQGIDSTENIRQYIFDKEITSAINEIANNAK
jgi:hypothetical protein